MPFLGLGSYHKPAVYEIIIITQIVRKPEKAFNPLVMIYPWRKLKIPVVDKLVIFLSYPY